MTDKNDGGPAFPAKQFVDIDCIDRDVEQGMSLRDWYAGTLVRLI